IAEVLAGAADALAGARAPDAACLCLGLAVHLDPQKEYLEALAELSEQAELDEAAVEVLTRLLALEDGAHRRRHLHFQLTRVLEPPFQGLLALAERGEDWATVVEVLEGHLAVEQRPKERAMVLTRIGELSASRLVDAPRAIAALEWALREYPRGLQARLL